MAKEIKRLSFEIEHSNGSTYMGFMLSVKEDGYYTFFMPRKV